MSEEPIEISFIKRIKTIGTFKIISCEENAKDYG